MIPDRSAGPAISVVVPVFGNAETLAELLARVARVLERMSQTFEVVFVDDASPDRSFEVLAELAATDERVVVVRLATNIGQHAAVLEGLRVAKGRSVVVMDADLQDRPESIPDLMAPVGYAAVFAGRRGRYESRSRLLTSRAFKVLLGRLAGVPSDAGLFVLLTREATDRLLRMPGRDPYVVAMIGCSGLRVTSVPIERAPRPIGRSAYPFRGRVRAAWRALRWTIAWRIGWSRRPGRAQRPLIPVRLVIGSGVGRSGPSP